MSPDKYKRKCGKIVGSEYGTKEVDFMNQNSFNRFHDSAENIRNKFLNALPVILYFLLMFYSVIFFFGMQYVMVVSLATLLFQVNYKKQHTVRSLLTLIAQQLFLLVLAYTATLHLASWLIFSKASPFNQLGYFSSLMTFTFLQLMHVGWNGFITQLEAMSFCCAVFFAAVLINSRILHPKTSSEGTEQKSMALLGCVLEKTLKGEDTKDERASLFELQRQLYREAYQNRGRTYVVTPKGKLKYMFALLMQRSVYFVSGQSRLLMPRDDVSREFAYQIAGYMKEAGKTDFMEGSTEELQRRGRMLLRKAEKGSDDFYRSSADFFRMFLLILRQQSGKNIVDERWEIPLKQRFKNRILYRMRPDTFEMRIALRRSVVLLVGMTFNMLSSEGHSYWFVMNAFLLLRPMYEDSRYRMKTRFIGTAAGCILITIILYFCNASVFHLLIHPYPPPEKGCRVVPDPGALYLLYRLCTEPDPGNASSEKRKENEEYQWSEISALYQRRTRTVEADERVCAQPVRAVRPRPENMPRISRLTAVQTSRSFTAPAACLRRFSSIAA